MVIDTYIIIQYIKVCLPKHNLVKKYVFIGYKLGNSICL